MQIRRLTLRNFRGISDLTWHPAPGINVLIGAGDSGKTTVLDAVALALLPQPALAATETDYAHLDTAIPFTIEVVLGALSDELQALAFPPALWGWNANDGELLPAPDEDGGIEPVINVRATGTADLELFHYLLQPGNEPRLMPVQIRAATGLWNVSTSRPPDAQLRMSRGSLLERAVGREALRAPSVAAMQGTVDTLQVPVSARSAVNRVASELREAGIDFGELALSLVPIGGQSPVQLVTLVAKSADGHVPLASFGRGSQQMAMVTLAAAQASSSPIAVIDELESGLEPYRQRALVSRLRTMVSESGQAIITTHSPAILRELGLGETWRLDRSPVARLRRVDGPSLPTSGETLTT